MKKQKRILKKVISVILALAMIISLVNVPAIGSEAASKKKDCKECNSIESACKNAYA